MAQAILVTTELTPGMIEAGRSLVAGLDRADLAFEAAFWLSDLESGYWHLFLSTKAVKMDGTRAQYAQVRKVIEKLGLEDEIWIGMISIVGDKTPTVKSLRQVLGTSLSVDGTRLDGAFVSGTLLAGCMLYRLSRRQ